MSNPTPRQARNTSFELRHLRYFVTLVEERNFERAAARLGIAQPGLSQQVMSLETIVGLPLLDRSRRAVNLTQAGHVLFEEAKKILGQADAALIAINRVSRGESGRISIGYVASAAYSGAVVQSIRTFQREHPDVEIQLVEMELRMQLLRISEGLLDFGYIRWPAPIPEGIATSIIRQEPLMAVLPSGHPLAVPTLAHLSSLAFETFLTPRQPADVGFHSNTIAACLEAGFEPKIAALGGDFTEIGSMVAIGMGVALVPRSLDCVRLPGVAYVALPNVGVTSDLAVAHRKTEAAPVVRAFIAQNRRPGPLSASPMP